MAYWGDQMPLDYDAEYQKELDHVKKRALDNNRVFQIVSLACIALAFAVAIAVVQLAGFSEAISMQIMIGVATLSLQLRSTRASK